MYYAYLVIVLAGLVSARVALLQYPGRDLFRRNRLHVAIGLLSTMILISLFVWGGAQLAWYWPFIAFAGGFVVSGFVVTTSSWRWWYRRQLCLDLAFIASGLLFWLFVRAPYLVW